MSLAAPALVTCLADAEQPLVEALQGITLVDDQSPEAIARALIHLTVLCRFASEGTTLATLPCAHPAVSDMCDALSMLADHGPVASQLRALRHTLARHPKWPALSFEETTHLLPLCIRRRNPDRASALGLFTTPAPVARAMMSLVADLGGLEGDRPFLDPASGTGAFPIALLEVARQRLGSRWSTQAPHLVTRIHGLELDWVMWLVGHVRVAIWLHNHGVSVTPTLRLPLERGDGLTAPWPEALQLVMGNPPYARLPTGDPRRRWITPFAQDSRAQGAGGHVKSLYNLYVAFWGRAHAAVTQGQICLVTPSAWLNGPGFIGMRTTLSTPSGDLYALDLRGDQFGGRRTANLLKVRPPIAIGLSHRREGAQATSARLFTLPSDLDARLQWLEGQPSIGDIPWRSMSSPLEAPVHETSRGSTELKAPLLTDIFTWQTSGVQFKRTWPVAHRPSLLVERWRMLLSHPDLGAALKLTRDRNPTRPGRRIVDHARLDALHPDIAEPIRAALAQGWDPEAPLGSLNPDAPHPPIVPYGWRAFDDQWCFLDDRLCDCPRRPLWRQHTPQQRYLVSLLTKPLGRGPSVLPGMLVPDMDHFCNRGGRDIVPLWRDDGEGGQAPNIAPDLLNTLSATWNRAVTPEDLYNYTLALLAHPSHGRVLDGALVDPGPRVPLTADGPLAVEVIQLGQQLFEVFKNSPPDRTLCWSSPPQPEAPPSYALRDNAIFLCGGRFELPRPEVVERISGFDPIRSWVKRRVSRGKKGVIQSSEEFFLSGDEIFLGVARLVSRLSTWASFWPAQAAFLGKALKF
ncbi:MAG: type ISP restriction/modification enzyme [Bradymonadia bacterium]